MELKWGAFSIILVMAEHENIGSSTRRMSK
jgi:hypothetical protein